MNNDYVIVEHTQTIGAAIRTIQSKKKSSILVIKDNKLCGILTEQDIVRRITFSTKEEVTVAELMNNPVTIVYEEDLLFHAVGKMRKNKFRHLPVININSYPVGIIDMHTALTAELGTIIDQIDRLAYDEKDLEGLKQIKQQQVLLAEMLIEQNVPSEDISYILSF